MNRYNTTALFVAASLLPTVLSKCFSQEMVEEMAALKGHSVAVYSISFSPDGRMLASNSGDGTIKLWEVATGNERATIEGHPTRRGGSGSFHTISFGPGGNIIVSAGPDDTIRIWDVSQQKARFTLKEDSGSIKSVDLSNDGNNLAFCSGESIKLWEVSTGKKKSTFTGHTRLVLAVLFSPDGKTLASAGLDEPLKPGGDLTSTIKLWDVSTCKNTATFPGVSAYHSLAFNPDGKILASTYRNRELQLLAVPSGKTLRILKGHTDTITSVAFSPDGKRLATAGCDNAIRLWNVSTGNNIATMMTRHPVRSIAFSFDGKLLAGACVDATIALWRLNVESN
jgi:WD40 repeat protein